MAFYLTEIVFQMLILIELESKDFHYSWDFLCFPFRRIFNHLAQAVYLLQVSLFVYLVCHARTVTFDCARVLVCFFGGVVVFISDPDVTLMVVRQESMFSLKSHPVFDFNKIGSLDNQVMGEVLHLFVRVGLDINHYFLAFYFGVDSF